MTASKAAYKTARTAMENGSNCCEAMLTAASHVWQLPLAEDTKAAAALFGEGMQSGCTCGALVGLIMASGIRSKQLTHPLGKQLPAHLNQRFKQEFGATCCRVIKQKRPVWQRLGREACIELTAQTAAMLIEEWEGGQNAR